MELVKELLTNTLPPCLIVSTTVLKNSTSMGSVDLVLIIPIDICLLNCIVPGSLVAACIIEVMIIQLALRRGSFSICFK